jgi:hypothetical protein
MAESADAPASHPIAYDLPCPYCAYNLRGLVGPEVQCPECGAAINTTDLRQFRHQLARDTAPAMADLLTAPILLILLTCLTPIAAVAGGALLGPPGGALAAVALAALLAVPWLMRTVRCCVRLGGGTGVRIVLMAQGVFVVMTAALFTALGGGVLVVWRIAAGQWDRTGLTLIVVLAAAAVLAGSFWAYRGIVARFRRRYLARRLDRG